MQWQPTFAAYTLTIRPHTTTQTTHIDAEMDSVAIFFQAQPVPMSVTMYLYFVCNNLEHFKMAMMFLVHLDDMPME